MNGPRMPVTIVIPTHNRLAMVRKNLVALSQQSYPAASLQVVVVADGCRDGTEQALSPGNYPFRLEVLSQPSSGAGSARNRGAGEAAGELLIFLDDDVIASPELVQAHVEVHDEMGPQGVVIGPYLLPPEPKPTYFGSQLRRWWENIFAAMAQPGYEFSYRDLLGGNFSLSPQLFRRVGGFDKSFRHAREDGELGARLIAAGAVFTYAPMARAEHQETTDLAHSIRRWRHEGRADVWLGRRHAALRNQLPLAGLGPLTTRLIYHQPVRGRLTAAATLPILPLLERLGMKRHWSRRFSQLQQYWYGRGVADELETVEALTAFRTQALTVSDGQI